MGCQYRRALRNNEAAVQFRPASGVKLLLSVEIVIKKRTGDYGIVF